MAGDWIKREKGFGMKPEVTRIAARCGITRREAAEALMEIFEWADANVVSSDPSDRDAPSVTLVTLRASLMDDISHVTGIGAAMVAEGWLLESDDGIAFAHFGRHNGNPAKSRSLHTKRQNRYRKKSDAVVGAKVTLAPSTSASPEKRREDNKEYPLPPCLDTPQFRQVWQQWVTYRGQLKARLVPTTIQKQLKQLEAFGHDGAIASLNRSMSAGWKGLFAPESSGSPRGAGPANPARVAARPGKYAGIGTREGEAVDRQPAQAEIPF